MKAYVLHGINNLKFEDVLVPEIDDDSVLVEVKAAGICSSDVPRIFVNGTYNFPTIPGHEFSGVVRKIGLNSNVNLLNKKVGVFPLIPCFECEECLKKNYEMCSNYNYLGSRCNGGFAQFVKVPRWNIIELPDNIEFEKAAMLEPLSVAMHSVKKAQIFENAKIAVIGTGMIGLAISQIASLFSKNKVDVYGRSSSKKILFSNLKNVNYYYTAPVLNNYDFVFEVVGSVEAINSSINSCKAGGTVVFVGNPSSDILIDKNTFWRILRKQLVIKGTWNSKYDGINESDWTEVISLLNEEKIDVSSFITHRFSYCELNNGLELMKKHKETYCKIMTFWNESE